MKSMTKQWLVAIIVCAAAVAAREVQDSVCLKCHGKKELAMKFLDGTPLSLFVDQARFQQTTHGKKGHHCVTCHEGIELDTHLDIERTTLLSIRQSLGQACKKCHQEVAARFSNDVHSQKAPEATSCTNCHDSHYGFSREAMRVRVSQTCAKCHTKIAEKYRQSTHGSAFFGEGNPDVPLCTDCHRPHVIGRASTPEFHWASVDVCERCHMDTEKMAKYGLSSSIMETYLYMDFHGIDARYSRKGGEPNQRKATCVACHSAHEVASKNSQQSLAVQANALKVCHNCHPTATAGFVNAWLPHHEPTLSRTPLVYLVRLFYCVFIPFIIAGLCALIIMDLTHLLFKRGRGHHPGAKPSGLMYERFSAFRRAEHALVIVTFGLLTLTGLPQKMNDTGWAEWIILAFGGMDNLRRIHWITGLVFATHAVFHIVENIVGWRKGRHHGEMFLTWKDFTDTIASLKFSLHLAKEHPKFDRYEFRQKFEYWGILFGGSVMAITGIILYFPAIFTRILPGEFIPAAKMAHSFEAVMALLVIVVWHMYCTILRPGTFPIDSSIFTGKISHERLVEEHPLEYARLNNKQN
jgi:predicted CXXCH cytochrome family protein